MMLVRFKVNNFLSIMEEQELCLFPSSVRKFREHVYNTSSKSLPGLLKSGLIFGANSSGKSNLIKAMAFSKKVITGSRREVSWNVPVFKLADKRENETTFTYEILLGDKCYNYTFSIKDGNINTEQLVRTTKYSENNLFTRKTEDGKVKISFNMNFKNREEENFHKTVCKGTRINQLFLNFINEQNPVEINNVLRDIYLWFYKKLTIIFPNTKIRGIGVYLSKESKLWDFYSYCLNYLDTGIDRLAFDQFGFDDPKFNVPDQIKNIIKQKMQEENVAYTVSNDKNDIYNVERISGNLIVKKLMAVHKTGSGKEELFDFSAESDGTNRIMDIILMLFRLCQKNEGAVVIVDELDRSFHSLITDKMFSLFFKKTGNIPSQLIATTHDLSLLDLGKFRRDEIWFIEKGAENQSLLYSMEEFKTRFDKNIRKAYKDGRFGAVPVFTDTTGYPDAVKI